MPVTIKDIAKRAGVSPSTVSRVCNNHASISKETKERVQKIIDELGYEIPASQDEAPVQPIRSVGIVLPPSDRETYETVDAVTLMEILHRTQDFFVIQSGNDAIFPVE